MSPQTIENYQNLLQTHLEEYRNLKILIDNLLFLTRIEHGQIPLNRKKTSANELINSIVEYYQYTAQEQDISIQIEGHAEIEVDEHLFKRVLSNILNNSLSHTKKGGTISITAKEKPNHFAEIIITDNGIGIEAHHLPLLCQGFYRVDSAINEGQTGLGLGLAIVHSIMKSHQGNIEIHSQVNQGTTVVLTLAPKTLFHTRLW